MSNSGKFLQKQGPPPIISNSMAKNVSQWRKAELEKEVERGLYRDGSGLTKSELSPASFVSTLNGNMRKNAQVLSSGQASGANWRGGSGEATRQAPAVYSPLWLSSNLNLPRDRATINSWCRSFYALEPFIQNAINLHSTYPISKLTIRCSNRKVESFFNTMIENIDLLNVCIQVAQEYWLLGETFVYGELDQNNAVWSRLVIQNPDYMVVKKSVIANEPLIMMRPDDNLRRIVFSNKPSDIEQRSQLNETIIEHVKRGENIPLDNFYVSHLARRISPYEVRGTGLPVSCFRQLMLFDQLREAKFAQAQNMINPLTLVKIGSADYKPQPADLDIWRNAFAEAQYDQDFKIFTHEAVTVERVGYNSGIIDISGDITQLLKEIFMGLMVPQVLMDGGGDITYSNGGVSLDVLRQRYMAFRNMMSNWLKNKIFAPISKLNEFYEYEDGEKKLIIPTVEWSHMSIFDTMDYIQQLVALSTGDQKRVSQQTLYRSLGLEYDEERRKMKKEDIQEAVRKKELASLEAMALNELRGLDEDSDIPEIAPSALPGQSPYADAAGQQPGGETGAGGAGGGLPPLPGLGSPSGGGGGAPPADLGLPPPPPTSGPAGGPGGAPGGGAPTPTPTAPPK
jgi:hypothetical protein